MLPHLGDGLAGRIDDGAHDADFHLRLGDRVLILGREVGEDVNVLSVLMKLLLLVIKITLMLLMLLLILYRVVAQRTDRLFQLGIFELEFSEAI